MTRLPRRWFLKLTKRFTDLDWWRRMMKRPLETISARNSYEQWLPALETSSREVFRMMLGAELGRCSPQPWKGSEFTAMVGLTGDLSGLLSLRCRQESATLV